jgi:predicted transcriptional regulator
MSNVVSSVRINGDAMGVLSSLAAKLGQPKAQIVERALKELEEKIFWADVHTAFERTAGDPEQAAQHQAEFELWDRASNADLKDESW